MQRSVCVLIPTYNNAKTLKPLLEELLPFGLAIIVINDGSTDETENVLSQFAGLNRLTVSPNRGKGFALRRGFKEAVDRGFSHAISIDSDGQHYTKDLTVFIEGMKKNPGALIIGARNMDQSAVPTKSSFGNRFSNFWYKVETGIHLSDTQSGYRLYPLSELQKIRFLTNRFEFEIEVIVRAAWNGISVMNLPISVYYPPPDKRISHFRPFTDFTRISILNTVLVCIALFYIKPRDLFRRLFLQNQWKEVFIDELFDPAQTEMRKSVSVGFGIFMGILPIWGFQLVTAIFLAVLFRLNKGLVIVSAHISVLPMIPLIIYCSYRFGAIWVADAGVPISMTKSMSLSAIRYNFKQYLVGSISLAVITGIFAGLITYAILKIFSKKQVIDRNG